MEVLWGYSWIAVLCLGFVISGQKPTGTRLDSMSAKSAPRITQQPPVESSFRDGQSATLQCVAEADREITYRWTKDGRQLTITPSGKFSIREGEGSLVISSPGGQDEGVYQCFASTDFGTGLSTKTTLKAAVLDSFPTVTTPLVHQPVVGQPLNLSCDPPRSYPRGLIYWGLSSHSTGSSRLEGIDNDDRILIDHNGRLYFANVLMKDSLQDIGPNLYYACIVRNTLLGKFVKGNEQRVNPINVSDIGKHAPRLMWSSPALDKAIRGGNKRLKCIFSGLPTPRVSWRRIGAELSGRASPTPESHNTEIEISKVDYTDEGRYECTGTNSEGSLSRTLTLVVESMPYWRQNKIPSDVDAIEDDPVEIDCLADGSPRPVISWFIDGTPIQNATRNVRRRVEGTRIAYDSVTISRDRHVFQCSATNEHGQILANIALNILASPPSFLLTPSDTKVVEGHHAMLPCRSAGAPRPKVTWRDPDTGSGLQQNRFITHSDGSLEIRNADLVDSGLYECFIENKFGSDSVTARLLVRKPTVINSSPRDVTVNVTDDVTLQCDVTTDPEEASALRVTWTKNGKQIIDTGFDRRFSVNPNDFSLTIRSSEVDDGAKYACHADNGLDNATSNVGVLTVRGPPRPPTDVHVTCSTHGASVRWRPAPNNNNNNNNNNDNNNNDRVNEYVVYYNRTDDDPSGHVTECTRVTTPARDLDVPREFATYVALRPWGSFSFFVVAVNSMGQSSPGQASDACTTPPAMPSSNPRGVCSKLLGPRQLIIVWEVVPREERNGEGFHYRVGYRRRRRPRDHPPPPPPSSTMDFEVKTVRDPHQTELVIHDQESFQQFEIYVQSANDIGAAPLGQSDKRIGYSGEGKPSVVPSNVYFNEDSLNSTFVEITWNSVDTSLEKINGFFKGYRIEFWRVNRPDEKRSEDIILNPHFDSCPSLSGKGEKRKRRNSGSDRVRGSTGRLWPNSRIRAGVLVLNQANFGRLSDVVEFQTPEGVPDAVSRLEVTESGSNHLVVEWSSPLEENGVISNYILTYAIAPPHLGLPRQRTLPPTKRKFKILDLFPASTYVISLAAETMAGRGQSSDIHGSTVPQTAPSKPLIGDIDVGDNSANVSWIPSGKEKPGNPGSRFYVEYRQVDDTANDNDKWSQTEQVTDENWTNVGDLRPGQHYEFRIVAVNGQDDNEHESRSDISTVYIPREGERSTKPTPKDEMVNVKRGDSVAWWFIILMCIIVILLILLLVICLVYRSRGQMYPVYEKERLWGSPHKNEDQPFGEYARENPPLRPNADLRKSRESLESDEKPLDSSAETSSGESIGAYDDADASKFNEDGSFIGAYNRTRNPGSTAPAPAPTASNDRRAFKKQHLRSEDGPPPPPTRANTYV